MNYALGQLIVDSINERRREKGEIDFLSCMTNTIHVENVIILGQSKGVGFFGDPPPQLFACIKP